MIIKYSEGEDSSKLQLPNDWSEIKIQKLLDKGLLIDHLDGNHGELYPSAEEFSDEGVPYVSANNFSNGVVDLEGCKKLPEARAKQFKKGIARNDDVIFAHNATVGPVALLKTDLDYVILGTTATYYRCDNDKLLNHYLLYAMQSNFFVKQYSKVMFQSTRSQVPITAQRKLSLLIPSYPEQKAIAQVLSTADAAIHTTEKLIAQKELRKKWLMQQLLMGKKRLLNDELGMMNDEWKPIRIGDVFKFIKSFSISREGLQNDDLGSVYCIHYGDIHAKYDSSFLDFEIQKNIPQLIDNSISIDEDNYLQDGDIVMADASEDYEGVGAAVEVKSLKGKKAVGGLHTLVLRADSKTISPDFAAYFFSSEKVRNTLRKYATGTSVYSVTKTQIHNLSFIIPNSLKEQTAIAQVLQAADKEISLLKAKAEKLREQKKGLMQQLLTGKIRLIF